MNKDLEQLIIAVAAGDMQKAKTYTKIICASNKAAANKYFCERIIRQIETTNTNWLELPAKVSGFLLAEDTTVSFNANRYYLSEREKLLADRLCTMREASQKLWDVGISYLNAAVLHGPSGTGKTQFGRYLANRLGLPFVCLNLARVISSYMGSTSKNIADAFEYVQTAPCVFMLDEMDAIGLTRTDGSGGPEKEMSRVTIALMQCMDKLRTDNVLLAATNRIELIDPAVLRRFTISHAVVPFNADELMSMSKAYLDDVAAVGAFDVNYSERDLRELCTRGITPAEATNIIIRALAGSLQSGTAMTFRKDG